MVHPHPDPPPSEGEGIFGGSPLSYPLLTRHVLDMDMFSTGNLNCALPDRFPVLNNGLSFLNILQGEFVPHRNIRQEGYFLSATMNLHGDFSAHVEPPEGCGDIIFFVNDNGLC